MSTLTSLQGSHQRLEQIARASTKTRLGVRGAVANGA